MKIIIVYGIFQEIASANEHSKPESSKKEDKRTLYNILQ